MPSHQFTSRHPQYSHSHSDWVLMRDSYKGERQVKSKGTIYLPPTSGQILDGYATDTNSIGHKSWLAYKLRARFPMFVREAIQTALGMMHSQPPRIELPSAMEGIRSSRGETLSQLLLRINFEQLLTGRIGLMVDLPSSTRPGEDVPYLTTYTAERIVNWDDGTSTEAVPQLLNMVVLDESEDVRDGLSWSKREKYRTLVLGDFDSGQAVSAQYRQAVFKDDFPYDETKLKAPTWRGRTLTQIPFVMINSGDITAEVDDPPLMDLGNICMTIYRGEADYRQNLFMQGQDTFVTIGGQFEEGQPVRTGAGSRVDLPLGADAKYVGVTSSGLQEQREALARLESRAGTMGAQTLDSTSRERESGSSLQIRVAARTADLNQVADTGAAGLEVMLKLAAEWIDEDPEKVKVIPNKEFGEVPMTGQDMVELSTAKEHGYPISARTLHEIAYRRRFTSRTFEEELKEIEAERGTAVDPMEKAKKLAEITAAAKPPTAPPGQTGKE